MDKIDIRDLRVWRRYRDTKYIVTPDGEIYNERTGRRLKAQSNGQYSKVTLTFNGKQKQILLHRVIAECFIPNPQQKREVNHKNGNKYDNRVENLEWVTPRENQIHAVKSGLKPIGIDLWNAKFTKEQVVSIIEDKKKGLSCKFLAKKYECCRSTISEVSRGLRYKEYFKEEELQNILRDAGIEKEITI